jgi:hypothetical protein
VGLIVDDEIRFFSPTDRYGRWEVRERLTTPGINDAAVSPDGRVIAWSRQEWVTPAKGRRAVEWYWPAREGRRSPGCRTGRCRNGVVGKGRGFDWDLTMLER